MFSEFFCPCFWQPPNPHINPHSPIFPTKTPVPKRPIPARTAAPSGAARFFLLLLSFYVKSVDISCCRFLISILAEPVSLTSLSTI